MSSEGKMPSEVAGIKVKGDNKWMKITHNVRKHD